jgi:hypothetical protein
MEDLSEELDFLDLAIWLLMYEEHGNGYSRLYTEFEEGSFLGMGSVGGAGGKKNLGVSLREGGQWKQKAITVEDNTGQRSRGKKMIEREKTWMKRGLSCHQDPESIDVRCGKHVLELSDVCEYEECIKLLSLTTHLINSDLYVSSQCTDWTPHFLLYSSASFFKILQPSGCI